MPLAANVAITAGSATQLFGATSVPLQYGVQVVADPANTGTIYVGLLSTITAGADANSGIPLSAGQTWFFPHADCPNLNNVYVWPSAASQKAYAEYL